MTNRSDPLNDSGSLPPSAEHGESTSPSIAPADTKTLVGKLFIVPAVVVCVMLGVAVVVILFGSSSIEKTSSVSDLISVLESDSGDRQYGMLLPSAKETWQAAQDLAVRLKNKDKEFKSQAEADLAAERIIALLHRSADVKISDPESDSAKHGLMLRQFLLLALGQLDSATAVPTLVESLGHPNAEIRRVAAQSLALMSDVPEAKAAVARLYPLVEDPSSPVRMVACLAVATLADRGDEKAVMAVARGLEGDREVQWNAATALARLGSLRGKLVLMNMVSRSFWEGLDLDYLDGGSRVQRRLTPAEVSDRLCASVEAAGRLDDADLIAELQKLVESDSSTQVREAARQALAKESGRTADKRAESTSLASEATHKGEVS